MRFALALLLCVFAFPAAADDDKPAPELHKIYVPYEKLDEVFGTDKERVMVPYKEFLELWKLKYGPKKAKGDAPLPFTVESARYDGRIDGGIAYFEAELTIEIFDDRWHRVPLAFSGVAFEEVSVDENPGVLVPTKTGYDLIVRGKGRHAIRARFVAGIVRDKEHASTQFGLPSVPLHRLQIPRRRARTPKSRIEPARAHSDDVNERRRDGAARVPRRSTAPSRSPGARSPEERGRRAVAHLLHRPDRPARGGARRARHRAVRPRGPAHPALPVREDAHPRRPGRCSR